MSPPPDGIDAETSGADAETEPVRDAVDEIDDADDGEDEFVELLLMVRAADRRGKIKHSAKCTRSSPEEVCRCLWDAACGNLPVNDGDPDSYHGSPESRESMSAVYFHLDKNKRVAASRQRIEAMRKRVSKGQSPFHAQDSNLHWRED